MQGKQKEFVSSLGRELAEDFTPRGSQMKEARFMEKMKADMERKAALKRLVKMETKMEKEMVRAAGCRG